MADLPATMKAVVFLGPKQVAVEDRPVPKRGWHTTLVSKMAGKQFLFWSVLFQVTDTGDGVWLNSATLAGHHRQGAGDRAVRLVCLLHAPYLVFFAVKLMR